ncbi:MAG: M48 family metallopeptidase [Oscillospiraceae bacterium]|nr:M48 family metallopeptidase [Oscillospiraceae bacterium]
MSLEITPQGEVLVRAPLRTSEAVIRGFAEGKQQWIETHLALVRERMAAAAAAPRFTEAEREALRARARPVLEARVAHFAPLVGVSWGKITIRTQRSRWGSCSVQGNLSFNALLLLAPPEVLDYVVIHELCHRKEMNHSPRFWAEVERLMPDWKARRLWLRRSGGALMARLPEK